MFRFFSIITLSHLLPAEPLGILRTVLAHSHGERLLLGPPDVHTRDAGGVVAVVHPGGPCIGVRHPVAELDLAVPHHLDDGRGRAGRGRDVAGLIGVGPGEGRVPAGGQGRVDPLVGGGGLTDQAGGAGVVPRGGREVCHGCE